MVIKSNPDPIAEQLRLCDEAATFLRNYQEAKGKLPPEELEKLRLVAEFHYAAISAYILRSHGLNDEAPN
ncbi:hypothetical protein [Pseudomonas sp. NyZ201]|uniref:hypothetical protein n=1 Tax=Pseudomonas sp. NyZ201 TaxID=3409857 RepID=UPI003CEBD4B9